jgi:KaiC/GvpD/RAD55 family RecA-like ATPase
MKEKLLAKEEEMRQLKDPMRFKEDEMLRREEEILHREKLMEEQLKRFEQMRAELGGQEEYDLKKKLEQLQAEVTAKEEEIKAKEKFISAKEEDLRVREQGVISTEIDRKEEERALEFKIEKVKTGTTRLDDLLMGGLPFGTSVLVYGPPFMGKEVLVNNFVFEGLAKGIPAVWVVTDKTPAEIRDEMRFVKSGFEEYEKLGLVKFVDSYSRSMGDTTKDDNVIYVDSPTDFQGIQNGIEEAGKQLLEKYKYYRFVFRSISTMIAYLDPTTAFRFLNPIVGRRKRDKAVSMYLIEKGMHGDQEIQMVGSLMDGMVEFKVENLNTFLCVKGIGDVQSRAWIRYTTTKSAVNIGSFALDHIR